MRQIFVDSRDRTSGTPCDFSIELKRTLVTTDRSRMRLDFLRLPIVVPTINSRNNGMKVKIGSTTYEAFIPQRQYDSASLATAIQNRLALTAPGSWQVVYDVNDISMTIYNNNVFEIVGGSFFTQLMSRPYTYTTSASVTKYRFSYVPLNGADVIFLCSDQFASMDIHGPNGSHDTLLPCNITSPFGSVQEFGMVNQDWAPCPKLSTNTLSFQLRDRDHNLLSDYVPNVSFLLSID